MANYASIQNMGDPSTLEWQKQNLREILAPNGQKWQVNRQAASAFEGLLKDLIANGYNPQSSGGFNYRPIRGGTRLSQHAFGNAIDVNASTNPLLSRGQKVVTDLPANTAEIAKKYGLEWGGNWKRPDAMHFEWRGPEQGNVLVAGAPSVNEQVAANQTAPIDVASGATAPALPAPINVGDTPVTPVQTQTASSAPPPGILAGLMGGGQQASQGGDMSGILQMLMAGQDQQQQPMQLQPMRPAAQPGQPGLAEYVQQFLQSRTA